MGSKRNRRRGPSKGAATQQPGRPAPNGNGAFANGNGAHGNGSGANGNGNGNGANGNTGAYADRYQKYLPSWMRDGNGVAAPKPARPRRYRPPRSKGGYTPGKMAGGSPLDS